MKKSVLFCTQFILQSFTFYQTIQMLKKLQKSIEKSVLNKEHALTLFTMFTYLIKPAQSSVLLITLYSWPFAASMMFQ